MTTDPIQSSAHPPGSTPGRIAEAYKQLAHELDRVDVHADADLADALTDGVRASDRAYHLAAGKDRVLVDAVAFAKEDT